MCGRTLKQWKTRQIRLRKARKVSCPADEWPCFYTHLSRPLSIYYNSACYWGLEDTNKTNDLTWTFNFLCLCFRLGLAGTLNFNISKVVYWSSVSNLLELIVKLGKWKNGKNVGLSSLKYSFLCFVYFSNCVIISNRSVCCKMRWTLCGPITWSYTRKSSFSRAIQQR